MAKAKKTRRTRKTIPVAQTIGAGAAMVNIGIPFIDSAQKAIKGDFAGAAISLRDNARQHLTGGRLVESALMAGGPALVGKGLRMVGVKSPRIGKVRLF